MPIFDIRYNSKLEEVELVYPNGKTDVLATDSPTEPIKSPDKTKAVYISPLEWEAPGSLYLVDLKIGEQEELVVPEDGYIPKNVIWQDDEHVLVIIGFGDGTVAVGGNIYSVNIKTKDRAPITEYDDNVQISDLHLEDGVLHYRGIKYNDENFMKSEIYTNKIVLDSLKAY
ncbi:DUF4652 domain-containing protein [Bacillus sp. REN16]|uniref:DUF4652 domain-containing protein n=1 Tax=Bacillus sp. REN16 TaxID=2887296 RepID=UPI001E566FAA|nr:DUF4652 domain-containing protein [Bacillus sp. REN16]MCC3357760.1 DUF4652 domain-containing protein [Bacillus sp. REN16]